MIVIQDIVLAVSEAVTAINQGRRRHPAHAGLHGHCHLGQLPDDPSTRGGAAQQNHPAAHAGPTTPRGRRHTELSRADT